MCAYNAAMNTAGFRPLQDSRRPTSVDRLIGQIDQALRVVYGLTQPNRPYPAAHQSETVTANAERQRVCSLMRVNHAGEVSAQALYQGQALTARDSHVRASMAQAAQEEIDHLSWCATRLGELGGRTSLLNPIWYMGSFAIGALAGAVGDRTSLGFLAETEQQVVEHLQSHLARLPNDDAKTRAILQQMTQDESGHRDAALQGGGSRLAAPIRRLMKLASGVMTRMAYWV